MNWWSWMIGGAILLGAELGLVNAQFYLVFIGAAALAVGLASVAMPGLPASAQWALFAILATVSMLMFRGRLYGGCAANCQRCRPDRPAVRSRCRTRSIRDRAARSSTVAPTGQYATTARCRSHPARAHMLSACRPDTAGPR